MPELLKRIPLFISRFSSRLLLRAALLCFGPAVLLVIGAYYYATGGRLISTENAYVKADKIAISTDISGRVADIHVNENQYGDTALMEASQEGHKDIAKLLTDKGADLNLQTNVSAPLYV